MDDVARIACIVISLADEKHRPVFFLKGARPVSQFGLSFRMRTHTRRAADFWAGRGVLDTGDASRCCDL